MISPSCLMLRASSTVSPPANLCASAARVKRFDLGPWGAQRAHEDVATPWFNKASSGDALRIFMWLTERVGRTYSVGPFRHFRWNACAGSTGGCAHSGRGQLLESARSELQRLRASLTVRWSFSGEPVGISAREPVRHDGEKLASRISPRRVGAPGLRRPVQACGHGARWTPLDEHRERVIPDEAAVGDIRASNARTGPVRDYDLAVKIIFRRVCSSPHLARLPIPCAWVAGQPVRERRAAVGAAVVAPGSESRA